MKRGKSMHKEVRTTRPDNLEKASFSVSSVCTSSEPVQTSTPTIFSRLPGIKAK
jgi:hypothetical protein